MNRFIVLLVFFGFCAESCEARCADSNFINRALRTYTFPQAPLIKIRYIDSMGKMQFGVTSNAALFYHLWKQHGMYYNKYRPYMYEQLKTDTPLPFEKIRGLEWLAKIKPNPLVDSVSKEGIIELLNYFFYDKLKLKRQYSRFLNEIAAALFDEGVLLEKIEEHWYIMDRQKCEGLLP